MRPTVRIFADPDLPAVVDLSLRARAPVFESLAGVLGPSGVFPLLQPDWRADQANAVAQGVHGRGCARVGRRRGR